MHTSKSDSAFFDADLGMTRQLDLTSVSADLPDAGGALPEGRYLIQILDLSDDTSKVWVRTGKFITGTPLVATAAVPCFPMSVSAVLAIEFNVLTGVNDRIAAIVEAGGATAKLFITKISGG